MDVPADPKISPTCNTTDNQTDAEHGPTGSVELHAVSKPNNEMPAAVFERYTAREETTMKALRETQRDIETTLEANSIISSDRH
ncbi:MAG: hypothetical protein ACK4P4_00395 [Allorhizobium sp.]